MSKNQENLLFCRRDIQQNTVPEKVINIDIFAFSFEKLASISFDPNSHLIHINASAFRGFAISQMEIQVMKIEDFAFFNCQNLETVKLKEDSKSESIGNSVFRNTKLKVFVIYKSIKSIRTFCFKGLKTLKKIRNTKKG